MRHALLFSVFVIASCGLAYELIAGALSSYLLGDSVMQFSTVIGTYLFAMGVGSWLSKYITRDLIGRFIQIELMVGLLGGFSAIALFVPLWVTLILRGFASSATGIFRFRTPSLYSAEIRSSATP